MWRIAAFVQSLAAVVFCFTVADCSEGRLPEHESGLSVLPGHCEVQGLLCRFAAAVTMSMLGKFPTQSSHRCFGRILKPATEALIERGSLPVEERPLAGLATGNAISGNFVTSI